MSTQTSLLEILGEIERDANAGLSVNPDRLDCLHNQEKLRLVKALRRAVLYIDDIGRVSWSNHVKAELVDLLIEPVEPEEVENRNLGEPGAINA